MGEKRIDFISFEEFGQLYKASKEDRELRLALLLGYGSGLRISEILGLEKEISSCCKAEVLREKVKIGDKNRKMMICSVCRKSLTVREIRRKKGEWKIPPLTADRINIKEHKINLELTKGGEWRTVITAPNLTQELVNLLPLTLPRRTLQYRFEVLAKKILNKNISFHVLRHGFGNYQANVINLPLPMVQQMMGHKRLDTTGIYTKANPDHTIKKAWELMTGEK